MKMVVEAYGFPRRRSVKAVLLIYAEFKIFRGAIEMVKIKSDAFRSIIDFLLATGLVAWPRFGRRPGSVLLKAHYRRLEGQGYVFGRRRD